LFNIDAVLIATPDHWHAPAALLAVKAGKHVYLEKPCSHSPEEGEILIKGAQKYNRIMQMGNQRRSWPNVVEAIEELKNGIIGNVYFGKSWYTNNRPSIGIGKEVPVPEWLDWDLWQGPAPRVTYKDNIHPYNWHWFWRWGTVAIRTASIFLFSNIMRKSLYSPIEFSFILRTASLHFFLWWCFRRF